MEGLPRTQSLPPRIKGKNSYASTLRNLSATILVEIDDCGTEVSKSDAASGDLDVSRHEGQDRADGRAAAQAAPIVASMLFSVFAADCLLAATCHAAVWPPWSCNGKAQRREQPTVLLAYGTATRGCQDKYTVWKPPTATQPHRLKLNTSSRPKQSYS